MRSQILQELEKKEQRTLSGKMRILIFGTGKYFLNRKNDIYKEQIVAFLDNDNNKQGKFFEGKPVFSPDKVQEIDFDYVVIMATYYDEIKLQLINLGVAHDKILKFEDYCLVDIVEKVEFEKYYDKFPVASEKDILLGRKTCQSGEELWQYYDFLKMILIETNKKEPWRINEYEKKLRVLFKKQVMLIDKEKLWSRKVY